MGGGMVAMRTVFAGWIHIALAAAVAVGFFMLFSALDEYLFFEPVLIFHVPPDAVANFSLSVAISILLGIVISMNVYVLRTKRSLGTTSSWLSGSFIATATGACGCTSIGFALISTFGGVGILVSSFLTNYQIPLKMVSLGILFLAYYSLQKKLLAGCAIRKEDGQSL